MFDQFQWLPDRMLLGDLVFRLQHFKSDTWEGPDHFMFYKVEGLIKQYQRFFQAQPDFKPRNIFELGIFDGGSTAFWYEVFHPEKIVAIDLQDRKDSPYFQKYVDQCKLADHVRTYWNTDQSNKARLLEIAALEFRGLLDLVIDDCSHQYLPTLASFEALFPLLSPGGLYIIEDWAWGHWPEYIDPGHPWSREEPPTTLVTQFIEAAGSTFNIISSIAVFSGFVVLERGWKNLYPVLFRLEDYIIRKADKAEQALRLQENLGLRSADCFVHPGNKLSALDGAPANDRSMIQRSRPISRIEVLPGFDEDAYLRKNPDVEQAVRDGRIPSGWDHYFCYGIWENREGIPLNIQNEVTRLWNKNNQKPII